MKKLVSLSAFGALAPMFAFAQGLSGLGTTANQIVTTLSTIVNGLIPVVFGAALLFFFYGLARYILGGAEDKEKGRNLMIWGVVALFVMASIWGLVRLLQTTFGVTNNGDVTVPGVTP